MKNKKFSDNEFFFDYLKKEIKPKRKMGHLTIIKKSESLSSDIDLFTINDTRLLLSQKIKESFDPKKLLNPGKMYRGL